jgi:UDP-3-O-[3-hydroxymyristoyl] N-acetylglucosamine deacetylase
MALPSLLKTKLQSDIPPWIKRRGGVQSGQGIRHRDLGLGTEDMKAARQTTLRDSVSLMGVGVHSGLPVTLTIHPAEIDCGIRFLRSGLNGSPDREVRADVRSVTATEFATVLGDTSGPLCSTAEHVLAALSGLGIDNAIIEIDGPEVPIMDGSAAPFVAAIERVGVVTLAAPRRYIRVLKPVRVTSGECVGELRPYARGFRVEIEIAFDNPLVGQQELAFDVTPDSFRKEVARARTFGFMSDVDKLWSAGYARGATFDNTVVVSDDRVLNSEGLRFADEFVRHKALDAIGDLALAGLPLLGAYRSSRGGHKLNHAVISALMADSTAWAIIDTGRPVSEPVFAADRRPARRRRGQADIAA